MAKCVVYSGDVQGVGFRATAASIARRHGIKGWVRNCSDGSVELLAEGTDREVEAFLNDLRNQMQEHIKFETITDRKETKAMTDFRILG